MNAPVVIFGCGDVGRRIAGQLLESGVSAADVVAVVQSPAGRVACEKIGVSAKQYDLDGQAGDPGFCHDSNLYYLVPPQRQGVQDLRSRALLEAFGQHDVRPKKAVLISTTGVYGDYRGEWVDEHTATNPQTERGKRRLDSEQIWLAWGRENQVPVVILRVPGIYAFSRIPRTRIEQRIPVVRAEECGFTNRIHADDLAAVAIAAMQRGQGGEVYNVTDGTPGKITDYLQTAAEVIGAEPLPEISMAQARTELSSGMLSYLEESRKISNKKMLRELGVELRYEDFREGLKKG